MIYYKTMKLAVIKTGGKQYIIKDGDRLKVEKISAKEGDNFDFDNVLLVADKEVKIGAPMLEGSKVSAKVLKQGRSKKIVVFHYHSKTRYKKKAGHRQHFTEVKITKIS